MRTAIGLVLLNLWLLAVGYAVLRAIGLVGPRAGWGTFVATIGPAFIAGVGVLAPTMVLLLLIGIPLNVPVALLAGAAIIGAGEFVHRRRFDRVAPGGGRAARAEAGTVVRRIRAAVWAIAGVYAVYGAYAFAAAPTRGDDARIWSLRGLTLGYYHSLQPEIFLNQGQAGGHPQYPLLQPVVEALMQVSTGTEQLRIDHSELWLMVGASVWSAIVLIERRGGLAAAVRRPVWLAPLAIFLLAPRTINNIYIGDADINGQALLALAGLSLALWLDRDDGVCLAFGAVALVAAASTKNEDLLAAILLLLISGAFFLWRRRDALRSSAPRFAPAWPWLAAGVWFAVFILPWRLWLAKHHLTDNVTPPFPHALSPVYFIDRHRDNLVTASVLHNVFSEWGWLAPLFLATCAVCLWTGVKRRIVGFYLACVAAIFLSLVWLYVDTPLSLGFLIPTSMARTIGVFMVPCALATAHLLAALVSRGAEPIAAPRGA